MGTIVAGCATGVELQRQNDSSEDCESVVALIRQAFDDDIPLKRIIDSIERALIHAAYERHDRRWARVAAALRIPRMSLFKKRQRFSL